MVQRSLGNNFNCQSETPIFCVSHFSNKYSRMLVHVVDLKYVIRSENVIVSFINFTPHGWDIYERSRYWKCKGKIAITVILFQSRRVCKTRNLCVVKSVIFSQSRLHIVWGITLLFTTVVKPHFFCNFMMASSNGNLFRVTGHLCGEFTGEFPNKDQWRGAFVFYMRLNKRWSKQSRRQWFGASSLSSWRHCNGLI